MTNSKNSYVYFIQEGTTGKIKIGYSSNPHERLKSHQTSNSSTLRILGIIEGNIESEQLIHKRFEKFKVTGEWFEPVDSLLTFIENSKMSDREKKTIEFGQQFKFYDEIIDKLQKDISNLKIEYDKLQKGVEDVSEQIEEVSEEKETEPDNYSYFTLFQNENFDYWLTRSVLRKIISMENYYDEYLLNLQVDRIDKIIFDLEKTVILFKGSYETILPNLGEIELGVITHGEFHVLDYIGYITSFPYGKGMRDLPFHRDNITEKNIHIYNKLYEHVRDYFSKSNMRGKDLLKIINHKDLNVFSSVGFSLNEFEKFETSEIPEIILEPYTENSM